MSVPEKTVEPCGAPHPTQEGVRCERAPCVEYHRAGRVVWMDGALSRPSQTHETDPIKAAGILSRARRKSRESRL